MLELIQKNSKLSYETEKKVIAKILMDDSNNNATKMLSVLSRNDFLKYPQYFDIIEDAVHNRRDINTILLEKDLGTSEFMGYVLDTDFDIALDELRKISLVDKYLKLSSNSTEQVNYRNIENKISELVGGLAKFSLFSGEKVSAKESIRELERQEKEIEKKLERGDRYLGEPMGFDKLDNMTEGFLPASFNVLGATHKTGKTSFACNVILNFLRRGKRVVIYSLEMKHAEITAKLVALEAQMNPIRMRKGFLKEQEFSDKSEAMAKVYEYDYDVISIHEFEKMKLSMLKESMIKKVDLFVIDYLQLIGSQKYKTEYEKMSVFPTELKTIICEKTNSPILALSQISNEETRNSSDELSGFKGSGAIEATADLAIKLKNAEKREERDLKKKNRVPVNVYAIITNQRHGVTGAVEMSFDGYTGKFYEGFEVKI